MTNYTAALDAKRRISFLGDGLNDGYRVHHRADGVIELWPELASDVSPVSAWALKTIERSMAALDKGEASPAVDLSETFPNLGESGPRSPGVEVAAVPSSSEGTVHRALAALRRSATRARRTAAQTGTRLVVVRDGKVVIEVVEAPSPETSTSS